MKFDVIRKTKDKEGVFIQGEKYTAEITELDFIFKGRDSMNVWLKNERVDLEGLWATYDFDKTFQICS